jgi:hypothetical protein
MSASFRSASWKDSRAADQHNPKVRMIRGDECALVGKQLADMLVFDCSPLELDQQPSSVAVPEQQIDSSSKHNRLSRFEGKSVLD